MELNVTCFLVSLIKEEPHTFPRTLLSCPAAVCHPLAAVPVLPLFAARPLPSLSCRCVPPTCHHPCPAAVRCPLAAIPVLPLCTACSPLSLSLSCLLPGARLTLRRYSLLREPNSPSGGRTPKVSKNPEPPRTPQSLQEPRISHETRNHAR